MSLTLSIAFITLILGYLLGSSASNRHHRQRTFREQHFQLKHDQVLAAIENELVDYALNSSKVQSHFNASFTVFENNFRKNFTSCLETSQEGSGNESVDVFIRTFLREGNDNFLKCAQNMKDFLRSDFD